MNKYHGMPLIKVGSSCSFLSLERSCTHDLIMLFTVSIRVVMPMCVIGTPTRIDTARCKHEFDDFEGYDKA